jgi:hypothetical protein
MIMPPQLKLAINNIHQGLGYKVSIIQSADQALIQQVITALTANYLELKIYDAPKIEEIREIIELINVQALYATTRVIIVTNAQAMNTNSANALLKTLEEQKPTCFFMLFTQNTLQLLPTIVSRGTIIKLNSPIQEQEQEQIIAVTSDLLELWSSKELIHEIELAEKWCKLYDIKIVSIIWHCLHQLLTTQFTEIHSSAVLKKTAKLMPNKSLWAMFSKAQHALQIIALGITPNLQLLLEDLLLL